MWAAASGITENKPCLAGCKVIAAEMISTQMITEVDLDIQAAAKGNPTTCQLTSLFETLYLRLRTKQLCNQILTLSMNEIIDQKNTLNIEKIVFCCD